MAWIRPAFAGAFAGIAGTIAMDAVWYLRYRRDGGTEDPLTWEFGGASNWDEVSAPGQVGRIGLKAVMGEDPPDSWALPTQTAVHWTTGIAWGKIYQLVAQRRGSWAGGLILGPVAWGTSYVVLPPLGIYKPITEYDTKTLAKDLSAHLVYGVVTAAVSTTLDRRWRRAKRAGHKGRAKRRK